MDVGFFSFSLFLSHSISISFVERVGSVGVGECVKRSQDRNTLVGLFPLKADVHKLLFFPSFFLRPCIVPIL